MAVVADKHRQTDRHKVDVMGGGNIEEQTQQGKHREQLLGTAVEQLLNCSGRKESGSRA